MRSELSLNRLGQHESDDSPTLPLPRVEASAAGPAARKRGESPKDRWVWGASFLMTAFTVFVLLQTFVIGSVQQVAQAADFSSAVQAQEQAGDSAGAGVEAQASSESATTNGGPSSGGQNHAKGSGKRQMKSGGSRSGGSSGKSSSSSNAASNQALVAGAAAVSAGESIGSYDDGNVKIQVSKVRAYDTDIYVADVQVSSAEYLKTALAQNAFGRNLKETTSNMAEDNGAVLAINGDDYGFRDDGYVVRNGVLYRDTPSNGTDALVVYADGTLSSASQDDVSAEQLVETGAWQVLSFGPVLVSDGKLAVESGDEVDQSMGSNPRTAIGMVSPLHYVVVVSDGRTGDDAGLSLYQLAQVLVDNGATFGYNLDGGGSATMCFQGEVLNDPTSGNRSGERSVSDIVFFG
ncbi:MAG: phosphodiester glycosidase family protein [Eggerthellaceae bacterium]|nr:phosphodiester glycosidase family protein [Eggerthellaceae bacterium]